MSRAKVLLGVVVLAACYGAGVLYFYSSAAKWEGAELKESEQEHALQSKLQVLETERNVQKQTIEELTKELQKTRQEALGEMEQIEAALRSAARRLASGVVLDSSCSSLRPPPPRSGESRVTCEVRTHVRVPEHTGGGGARRISLGGGGGGAAAGDIGSIIAE